MPGPNDNSRLKIHLWRYYAAYFKGKTVVLLSALIAALVQALVMLPIAWMIGYLFDAVIPSQNVSLLIKVSISIGLLYGLNVVLGLWIRHIILKTMRSVMVQMRADAVSKLYNMSRLHYIQTDRANWQVRLIQDVERIVDRMSVDLLARAIPALLVSGTLCLVLALINHQLFIILLGMIGVLVFITILTDTPLRKQAREYHRAFERFNAGIDFILRYMDLTRLKAIEKWEQERRAGEFQELGKTFHKYSWLTSIQFMAQDYIVFVLSVVVLVVGGLQVAEHIMTIGDLITFFMLVNILRAYFKLIVGSVPNTIEGIMALERLYDLQHLNSQRPYSGKKSLQFNDRISLKDVVFSYGTVRVLSHLAMEVLAGETLALVGKNGSGKSTIAHLIVGFYRPDSGILQVDGIDYDEIDIRGLRRQIGIVSQNPLIFSGTIWENITYGHPVVDEEQVYDAARLTTALHFIEQQPDGFETRIGDDGIMLSGGQRQHLAITRALIGNPRLLVLDEPTNHLDSGSVRHLMHNLRAHYSDVTILTLTHDVSVVEQMDRVCVLENGRIATSGDHFDLLSKNEFYRRLFQTMPDSNRR